MNAFTGAQCAYTAASTQTRTGKGLEYQAVAQVTRELKNAAEQGSAGFSALARALHRNLRLWTIFAADVADAGNQLPRDLRARLFYLSEFTGQHTRKVLARKADVAPLVEINTAILRGLRTGGA